MGLSRGRVGFHFSPAGRTSGVHLIEKEKGGASHPEAEQTTWRNRRTKRGAQRRVRARRCQREGEGKLSATRGGEARSCDVTTSPGN